MSKKVKDLTLEEIKNICNDHYPSCRKDGKRCPLYDKTISCDSIISIIRSALRHNPDALEEEIEISKPKEEFALPKKPKRTCACDKTKFYYCPECNVDVYRDMKYCCECGQALDWSDEDDR